MSGSFWLDEAAQALESARPLSKQLEIAYDFQPPLLHLLLHFAIPFSQKEAWLRIWGALIPSLFTIYLTIKLGEKTLQKNTGALAGLLLGISSFHIYFSQELRPYALPALFATLSWFIIIKNQKAKTIQLWSLVLSTIAGLYSSYLYPFIVIGQFGYALFNLRDTAKRQYFISVLLAVLAFLPWMPKFLEQLQVGGTLRQDLPGWEEVVSIPQLKAIPLTIAKFTFGVLDITLTPFFLCVGLLLSISLLIGIFALMNKAKANNLKILFIFVFWFIVPLFTAWLISFIVPVVQPKRMLAIHPAFVLLISACITTLLAHKQKLYKVTGNLLLVTCIGVSIWSTTQYYLNKNLQRENWRDLHTQILTQYPKNSVVLFSFPEPFAPWTWYDKSNYPKMSTGVIHVSQLPDLSESLKRVTDYDTVLVFDYLRDLTDPDDTVLRTLKNFGYTEVKVLDYPGIGFVRVYSTQSKRLSIHL